MEENENENEQEKENSDKKPNLVSMKLFSSHADPLFASIVTFYLLIFLYFPPLIFLRTIVSLVLVIAFTLSLALLRFGATQRKENIENSESNCTTEAAAADHQTTTPSSAYSDQDHEWVTCEDPNFAPNPCFEDSFVEWNVRAPLEVIYEAYEGEEEEEEENVKDPTGNKHPFWTERYGSLSLYYPETDSDTSSDGGDFLAVGDWGTPESVCFRWEDEDREGLIEIALDNNNNNNERERSDFENFHGEEENNLIEIDISPARDEEKSRLSGE